MTKKVLMILFFVACALPVFADNALWIRTYGGWGNESNWGWWVQQTIDGGYIVVGWTTSFGAGNEDIYLIKTNSIGDTIWTRTYGGSGSDKSWYVRQTTDGGYIITGWTDSFGAGNTDVYLIKTDSIGDTMWTRTYGGSAFDYGSSVQQTTDGGYIITGWTDSFGAGNADVYLIKTDSIGDTMWTRTYGGSAFDFGLSVQQITNGGYIVLAQTGSFGSTTRSYLIETNSIGDTMWTLTYGGSGPDVGWAVQQTTDGGFIIGGLTYSFGAGSADVCLIKTDSVGAILWSRVYGGNSMDYGTSVQQTKDEGYIIAGWTTSFGAGREDGYLIKTNSIGDTMWTRTCGGSGNDYGWSVQQTTDGGYIMAGWTNSYGAGGFDLMLTKLDSLGNACIGEFVSPTVMSVLPEVVNPATVVSSTSTIVTRPREIVTSPATEVTTVCMYLIGDTNKDGRIDISDVVYLVNYLYKSGPAPEPLNVGDVNCDGVVDIGDVVFLINYLFKGGPAPDC